MKLELNESTKILNGKRDGRACTMFVTPWHAGTESGSFTVTYFEHEILGNITDTMIRSFSHVWVWEAIDLMVAEVASWLDGPKPVF